jgi:hypothetical protein
MAKSNSNSILHSYTILIIHSFQIVDRFSEQSFVFLTLIPIRLVCSFIRFPKSTSQKCIPQSHSSWPSQPPSKLQIMFPRRSHTLLPAPQRSLEMASAVPIVRAHSSSHPSTKQKSNKPTTQSHPLDRALSLAASSTFSQTASRWASPSESTHS